MPAGELVNKLRAAVGQSGMAPEDFPGAVSCFSEIIALITTSLFPPPGTPPILRERHRPPGSQSGTRTKEELPRTWPRDWTSPLCACSSKRKGFQVWSIRQEGKLVRTCVWRPQAPGEKPMQGAMTTDFTRPPAKAIVLRRLFEVDLTSARIGASRVLNHTHSVPLLDAQDRGLTLFGRMTSHP